MKITAKKKTKTMTNANETVQISVGNNELEQGNCFVCLRGKFAEDAGCTEDDPVDL